MKIRQQGLSDSEAQYKRMMETPIPRLVASIALPAVIGTLITVIYNTADTYFVSQLNKSASAAIGAVYSIMAIVQAFGYGLGIGAGSLISRRLGAKQNKEADKYASSAFFAAILVGMLIAVLGISFLEHLLRLLGCTDTMMPYAIPYAKYILLAAPINCATFVLNSTLRSEGFANLATIGIGAGGILNIFLDPLFIFKLNMGTGGAAIATLVSQTVSFCILGSMFVLGRSIVRIDVRCVSRRFTDYKLIVTTGVPTICRQGLGSLAAAVLNIQAIAYGEDAAGAAITIANKVYVLVRNISIGIGQGFQPVAGYNFGAGNKKRTWQSFVFTAKVGSVLCVLFAAVSALFAEPIMWWFCDDAEVAKIGIQTIYLSSVVMPVLAFSTYANQLYQCLGFKGPATFLASCRQGIFFLPAVILLPLTLGCLGVEAAQPIADLCTFFVAVPFVIAFYKKYISADDKKIGGQTEKN
ncbi:MAG: MATE family efflux transporter [Clostridia bacterium]|nr:MATE family efflux transporter [Clostridia bacterium]